jgi:hypothetical protein
MPPTQVVLAEQGEDVVPVPLELQVSTLLPEHCLELGTHTPEQLPLLHT